MTAHGPNALWELTAERDALAAEVERLREDKDAYSNVIDLVTAERDAARAEVEKLRAERDDLSAQALKQAAEIGRLRAELAGARAERDEGSHLDRIIADVNHLKAAGFTMAEFITGRRPAPAVGDDTSREA